MTTNTKDGKNIVRYCKSKQLGQQIKLNLNDKTQHDTLVDPQLEQILEDRKSKQLEQQIKFNLIEEDKSQHTLEPQLEQNQDDPDHN